MSLTLQRPASRTCRREPRAAARRQRGLSLVELLVSLVLGMAVLIGLASVYVAAKQSFRFQETSGRLQEDAVFALETIAKDLRMSGFAGCRGVNQDAGPIYYPRLSLATAPTAINGPNPLAAVESGFTTVTVQPLTPFNFLRGFDNVPNAMFASGSEPTTSGTDSLFFSGGSANVVSVTAAMTADTSALTIGTDPYNWAATTTPIANPGVYNMIVSNCITSSLFAGKVTTGGTLIAHDTTLGNAANAFPTSSLYGTDALVMPLEWSFYYVATRSGATTPSLYRVFYDGNKRDGSPQEIVANVESMQLHYGENLNGIDDVTASACVLASGGATCTPTLRADTWRTTAASVTNWSRVVGVRIGLMMVGADVGAAADVITATPPILGASYTLPTGASSTRLRKEFSTTVLLRNRIAPR
jgi:type IV pilus assembly protein PilW